VVKRDFRCETAVIRNRAAYDDPNHPSLLVRKPKINFIQDMRRKVSVSMELKNKGFEDLQVKKYRTSIKYFHRALLYLKALDPDEGVEWNEELVEGDGEDDAADDGACRWKEKVPLRRMPQKLKEIKEKIEIDCYLNLAICLFHKDQPPYRKIKDYCLRILELKDDHVKALVRAGMACYYLREYEVARFYLQSAKDFSHEPLGRISCQHCELLFKPLRSPF